MKSSQGCKKLYNKEDVLRNMQIVYNHCTSVDLKNGKEWYESAHSFSIYLSKKYSVTETQSAGIIAAFSPMKEWELNKRMCETFIESNGNISQHTGTQTEKAKQILFNHFTPEEIDYCLGGMKTINFFRNIHNPDDRNFITIDRHHLNVCYGENIERCTDKQYLFLKENTLIFANKLNLIPNQLQASLWVCWKRIKNNGFKWQNG